MAKILVLFLFFFSNPKTNVNTKIGEDFVGCGKNNTTPCLTVVFALNQSNDAYPSIFLAPGLYAETESYILHTEVNIIGENSDCILSTIQRSLFPTFNIGLGGQITFDNMSLTITIQTTAAYSFIVNEATSYSRMTFTKLMITVASFRFPIYGFFVYSTNPNANITFTSCVISRINITNVSPFFFKNFANLVIQSCNISRIANSGQNASGLLFYCEKSPNVTIGMCWLYDILSTTGDKGSIGTFKDIGRFFVDRSVLSNCSSITQSAGALYASGSVEASAIINDTTFSSCVAGRSAGVLLLESFLEVDVYFCSFLSCLANGVNSDEGGGALFFHTCSSTFISNSFFGHCTSAGKGGAVYYHSVSVVTICMLSDVVFWRNTAKDNTGGNDVYDGSQHDFVWDNQTNVLQCSSTNTANQLSFGGIPIDNIFTNDASVSCHMDIIEDIHSSFCYTSYVTDHDTDANDCRTLDTACGNLTNAYAVLINAPQKSVNIVHSAIIPDTFSLQTDPNLLSVIITTSDTAIQAKLSFASANFLPLITPSGYLELDYLSLHIPSGGTKSVFVALEGDFSLINVSIGGTSDVLVWDLASAPLIRLGDCHFFFRTLVFRQLDISSHVSDADGSCGVIILEGDSAYVEGRTLASLGVTGGGLQTALFVVGTSAMPETAIPQLILYGDFVLGQETSAFATNFAYMHGGRIYGSDGTYVMFTANTNSSLVAGPSGNDPSTYVCYINSTIYFHCAQNTRSLVQMGAGMVQFWGSKIYPDVLNSSAGIVNLFDDNSQSELDMGSDVLTNITKAGTGFLFFATSVFMNLTSFENFTFLGATGFMGGCVNFTARVCGFSSVIKKSDSSVNFFSASTGVFVFHAVYFTNASFVNNSIVQNSEDTNINITIQQSLFLDVNNTFGNGGVINVVITEGNYLLVASCSFTNCHCIGSNTVGGALCVSLQNGGILEIRDLDVTAATTAFAPASFVSSSSSTSSSSSGFSSSLSSAFLSLHRRLANQVTGSVLFTNCTAGNVTNYYCKSAEECVYDGYGGAVFLTLADDFIFVEDASYFTFSQAVFTDNGGKYGSDVFISASRLSESLITRFAFNYYYDGSLTGVYKLMGKERNSLYPSVFIPLVRYLSGDSCISAFPEFPCDVNNCSIFEGICRKECPSALTKCSNGECRVSCEGEKCPSSLTKCDNGECRVSCEGEECPSSLTKCDNGECRVSCEGEECPSSLTKCDNGECRVSCEGEECPSSLTKCNNGECRVLCEGEECPSSLTKCDNGECRVSCEGEECPSSLTKCDNGECRVSCSGEEEKAKSAQSSPLLITALVLIIATLILSVITIVIVIVCRYKSSPKGQKSHVKDQKSHVLVDTE